MNVEYKKIKEIILSALTRYHAKEKDYFAKSSDVGNLSDLTTTEKGTIVGSLNELNNNLQTDAVGTVFCTMEEYNALPDTKLTNGIKYYITDVDYFDASNIDYSNTESKLSASNIQGAIDEINNNVTWTLVGSVNNGSVDISSVYGKAREYCVIIAIAPSGSSSYKDVSNIIPAAHISESTLTYLNGWYYDDRYKATVATYINPTAKTIGIDSSWTILYNNSTIKVDYDYCVAVYYR